MNAAAHKATDTDSALEGTGIGGWGANAKLVNEALTRIEDKVDCLDVKLNALTTRVAVGEVKAGFWGAVSGALAAIATAVVHHK